MRLAALVGAGVAVVPLAGTLILGGTEAAVSAEHRAGPRCFGAVATIVGDERDNTLRGTGHRDVIVALGGNDTVLGLGGRDLICGGAGLDGLDGGPGDDSIGGGKDVRYTDEGERVLVGDDLWGGAGDDLLRPGFDPRPADRFERDRLRWDRDPHAVHVDLRTGRASGQGHDVFEPRHVRIVGSTGGDTVIGSQRADWILTGDGPDTVTAGAGDDVVWTDFAPGDLPDGADVASGGEGDDQVYAEGGADRLSGGAGDDQVMDYGDSADQVRGGTGRDLVGDQLVSDQEGAPTQLLEGGSGHDSVDLFSRFINPHGLGGPPSTASLDMVTGRLAYDDPDDSLVAAVTSTEVVTLLTWGTVWEITGTPGDDMVCAGGSDGTTFHALGGDDTFSGSAGDDLFDGGSGTDLLLGTSVGADQLIDVETTGDDLCGDFDLD